MLSFKSQNGIFEADGEVYILELGNKKRAKNVLVHLKYNQHRIKQSCYSSPGNHLNSLIYI